MQNNTRNVFLLIYWGGAIWPDHWALWIPFEDDERLGTVIHVEGEPANGFRLEFKRNFDREFSGKAPMCLPLDRVDAQYVVEVARGAPSKDQIPHDRIEEIAHAIPAPGGSLKPKESLSKTDKVVIQNCQSWLKLVVASLVEHQIMQPAALDFLNTHPEKYPQNAFPPKPTKTI